MSSSSSSGGDADWKPVPPCGCGWQHYRAIKMEWHAHPLGIGTKLQILNAHILATTMFGPAGLVTVSTLVPGDKRHHAVLVYFICGACSKVNRCTYDFSNHGKENRWGYYGRSLQLMAVTNLYFSYEKVEDVFRGMWTKYSLHGGNCKDWACDFYNRVNEKCEEERLWNNFWRVAHTVLFGEWRTQS
uniref:Pentatricopeptide repeat-containing protein n=1 Tax=Globodera pallida TaxID=36090 RepID=A0A183C074_GLOPA